MKRDKVVNEADEGLGKIEEIMLHVPSGRVAYAVLSFGGFLGMGDKAGFSKNVYRLREGC